MLPDPLPAPPSTFLGALGHTGVTAWLGLETGDPRPGETVVISAGAVGTLAQQLMDGSLKASETTVEGSENSIDARNNLFEGGNGGKLVLAVS